MILRSQLSPAFLWDNKSNGDAARGHELSNGKHQSSSETAAAWRLLLLALFSKHPDIRVTLVNRSVEKAETVLQDDLVKARGGQNATASWLEKKRSARRLLESVRSTDQMTNVIQHKQS